MTHVPYFQIVKGTDLTAKSQILLIAVLCQCTPSASC